MNDDSITPPTFDSLLEWLDPDRDQAGKIYEQIRRRLIKIFECRGCHDADVLADTTFDRVTSKVPKIAKDYVGEKSLYFYGVAQNVYRESIRKRPPVASPPPIEKSDDIEKEFECLDRCVLQLTASNRDLVLEYYQNDKRAKIEHRRALAEKLGVAQNALRIRAHRIRLTLQQCLQTCLEHRLPG
jgi:DNA-directed RNA polymerase specialized sigma24 family protein